VRLLPACRSTPYLVCRARTSRLVGKLEQQLDVPGQRGVADCAAIFCMLAEPFAAPAIQEQVGSNRWNSRRHTFRDFLAEEVQLQKPCACQIQALACSMTCRPCDASSRHVRHSGTAGGPALPEPARLHRVGRGSAARRDGRRRDGPAVAGAAADVPALGAPGKKPLPALPPRGGNVGSGFRRF